MISRYYFILLVIWSSSLSATFSTECIDIAPYRDLPVAFQGRFRPMEAYARLWLYEFYHRDALKKEDLAAFQLKDSSALSALFAFYFSDDRTWDAAPFFWIENTNIKEELGLKKETGRFSYQELREALYANPDRAKLFLQSIIWHRFLKNPTSSSLNTPQELPMLASGLWVVRKQNQLLLVAIPNQFPWSLLRKGDLLNAQDEAEKTLQQKAEERLKLLHLLHRYERRGSSDLLLVPSRYGYGEWLSLRSLGVQKNSATSNFTLWSDAQLYEGQKAYQNLIESLREGISGEKISDAANQLANILHDRYTQLAGQSYLQVGNKNLAYPSWMQLKLESWYYRLPLIATTCGFYVFGIALFLASRFRKNGRIQRSLYLLSLTLLICGFIIHTGLLGLRCYILQRPPVASMSETALYVPWISFLAGTGIGFMLRSPLVLPAAAAAAVAILMALQFFGPIDTLENVQPVLDSQLWLLIHVLLVVGSYGAFALASVLGHAYLIGVQFKKQTAAWMRTLHSGIIQGIYLGVSLLLPGTLLGGIWAAQSWGRFWDWDPKESWAFISICTYLLFIHAFRKKQLGPTGLATGAVLGFLAISFTWYGVNYILGTGLHSYGFGNGGERYYLSFFLGETLFLLTTHLTHRERRLG